MARDKTLTERIESILYAHGVTDSGTIAADVAAEVAEGNLIARAELTLGLAYAQVMPEPTTNRAAVLARMQYALDAIGGSIVKKVPDNG